MTDLIAELAEVVRKLGSSKWWGGCGGFDAMYAHRGAADACVAFIRTHHAEIVAMARDARGEREESWEVWQDDMPVAVSDELPDALHYLAMYQQDGPVTLKRSVIYRETITPEQIAAMHDSAREGGE